MLQIPPASIISSKLSPLQPADIPRIVHLAQSKCTDSCLEHHLQSNPETALIAVGISNQHDLQRVLAAQVPVIHIEHDCQALQGAHRRQLRDAKYMRILHNTLSSGLWGLFFALGSKVRNRRLYPALLTAYSLYVFRAARNDYSVVVADGHFLLIRSDARHTPVQFIVRTVIPYCVQCASMLFLLRGALRWCWQRQPKW